MINNHPLLNSEHGNWCKIYHRDIGLPVTELFSSLFLSPGSQNCSLSVASPSICSCHAHCCDCLCRVGDKEIET